MPRLNGQPALRMIPDMKIWVPAPKLEVSADHRPVEHHHHHQNFNHQSLCDYDYDHDCHQYSATKLEVSTNQRHHNFHHCCHHHHHYHHHHHCWNHHHHHYWNHHHHYQSVSENWGSDEAALSS